MSSARPGKPLFELLRDDPDAPRPARAGAPPRPAARSLRLPVSTAYIAGALVVGLVLLAWVGGHAVGFEAGKNELARAAAPGALDALTLREPAPPQDTAPVPGQSAGLANPQPAAGQLPDPEPPATTPAVTELAPPGPAPVPAAGPDGDIITARGFLAQDPRQPGANYLVLATLTEGQATEAVQFLASHGVEAIGVPASPGANRYRVVSMGLAVPSGQYRATASARREHERKVAALGARWLREHQGASDFSQPQWALYQP